MTSTPLPKDITDPQPTLKARSHCDRRASGIGLATAKAVASRGASIVAEDINPEVNNVYKDNGPHCALSEMCERGCRSRSSRPRERAVRPSRHLVNNEPPSSTRCGGDDAQEWDSIPWHHRYRRILLARSIERDDSSKIGCLITSDRTRASITFPGIIAYADAKRRAAQSRVHRGRSH